MPPDQQVEEVILLIHGIRTEGHWAQRVANVLQSPTIKVHLIAFKEFVDIFRFWLPNTREPFIESLEQDIRDAIELYPDLKISVIAHSFGTYAIARVLKDHTDIRLHKLVLCGSVLPRNFRWKEIRSRLDRTIINDCGARDWLPSMAKNLSWGYGSAGTYGFGSHYVRDRFHDIGHSDYFKVEFVDRYWRPWFHNDELVCSEWDEVRPPTPFFMYLLDLADLKWIIGLVLWILILFACRSELDAISSGLGYVIVSALTYVLSYQVARSFLNGIVGPMVVLLFLTSVYPIHPSVVPPAVVAGISKFVTESRFDSDGHLLVNINGLDSLPSTIRELAIVGKTDGGLQTELVKRVLAPDPTAQISLEYFDLVGAIPGTVACRASWYNGGQKEYVVIEIDDKPQELPPNFEVLSDNPETDFVRWLGRISEARLSLLMKEPNAAGIVSKRAVRLSLSEFDFDLRKVQILFDGMTAPDLRTMLQADWKQRPAYRDFNYTLLETDIDKFIKDYSGFADLRARILLSALQRKAHLEVK